MKPSGLASRFSAVSTGPKAGRTTATQPSPPAGRRLLLHLEHGHLTPHQRLSPTCGLSRACPAMYALTRPHSVSKPTTEDAAVPLPPPRVDLRSDTVTLPTEEMRAAMASAVCGDDVMQDDPTVKQLEAQVAELLGKEAGLFVPSGTMGNLLAVCTWCDVRGSEYVVGSAAHIHIYEQGGTATLGGVHPRVLPNAADGTMDLAEIEACVRPDDIHFAELRLVCLETTHNKMGGVPLSLAYIDAVGALCATHSLALHIDGARICNAAAALGVPVSRVAKAATSVSVCLSKGLGAPVGTVLVGPPEFIRKARRLRKALGGGMRQSGVLAAAGLVALRDILPRLGEDHANMRRLAEGLSTVPGIALRDALPHSNLAYFTLSPSIDWPALQAGLRARGIAVNGAPGLMRLVMHHQVSAAAVEEVIELFRELCTAMV